ncbi:rCG63459 [Rattus norvegicus]|uniref:RCG63459 n=1 Tax=Rattus norvegicus TaxID=10116 RepID=A6HCH9_RAT|nr:rCG63459 [Rattus norvegicus]
MCPYGQVCLHSHVHHPLAHTHTHTHTHSHPIKDISFIFFSVSFSSALFPSSLFFEKRVSLLCNSGCAETHYIDPATLELTETSLCLLSARHVPLCSAQLLFVKTVAVCSFLYVIQGNDLLIIKKKKNKPRIPAMSA